MNYKGFFSGRFLVGVLLVITFLIYFGGVVSSENIILRSAKSRPMLKEIQSTESPDFEKIQSALGVTVLSGVRG